MAHHDTGAAVVDRREDLHEATQVGGESVLTRNENIVYRELLRCEMPAKAYELLERLMDQGLRSPMTIYRALDSLIRKGFAKKVVSLNAYMALKPDSVSEVSAFMTCRNCNQTTKIELTRKYVEEIFGELSMSVGEVFIEAHGECTSGVCTSKRMRKVRAA